MSVAAARPKELARSDPLLTPAAGQGQDGVHCLSPPAATTVEDKMCDCSCPVQVPSWPCSPVNLSLPPFPQIMHRGCKRGPECAACNHTTADDRYCQEGREGYGRGLQGWGCGGGGAVSVELWEEVKEDLIELQGHLHLYILNLAVTSI